MTGPLTAEQDQAVREIVASMFDAAMVDAGRHIAMVLRGNVAGIDVRYRQAVDAVHDEVSPTAGVATS